MKLRAIHMTITLHQAFDSSDTPSSGVATNEFLLVGRFG